MGCGFLTYMGEHFWYYNAPEGQDPVGKIVGFGQLGVYTGTLTALYDAIMWSHCANAPQFFNTLGFWVVPLTGACVTFSAVTYTLCNLRKKDDKTNYIGGGLAAGSVFHVWTKNIRKTAWATALILAYGLIKKQRMIEGLDRHVLLTPIDEELHRKWFFSWRNVEYRNYSSKPWFPHDKTDYYKNHF